MNKKLLDEIFELSAEEQEELVNTWVRVKNTKYIIRNLNRQLEVIYKERASVQEKCTHPTKVQVGRDTRYYYTYSCPACDKSWSEPVA